ncbi:MAG TPA: hypothetical protein VFF73_17445, partial [Planctomycetota bacterium]|nr:hypothetical protein [Planctomycetota bacterium]
LLEKGVVVNPPVAAQPADGSWVPPSPHEKGTCFDISGATFAEVSAALARARRQGGLRAVLKEEPKNHCVHVQVLE